MKRPPKTLFIDSSSNKEIIVSLRWNNRITEIRSPIDKQKAQVILPLIDKLLAKCDTKLKDITGIEVVTGSGSFTGLRVGIAVANTLSFALKIPLNNKKVGEYEIPKYE